MTALSLRSKFLLIVVLGAVLPLAIVGWWLSGTAARSGRALLHDQLSTALSSVGTEANDGWSARSGELQLLANNTVAQAMLSQVARPIALADSQYLLQLATSFSVAIPSVTYLDTGGHVRWSFDASRSAMSVQRGRESRTNGDASLGGTNVERESGEDRAAFSLDMPVLSDSGRVIGALRARVRLSSVLRTDSVSRAALGAVLEVRDTLGALVFPLNATSGLSDSVRLGSWERLTTPLAVAPLRVSLARSVAPFVQPFERAARAGLSVLMLVALAALLVSAVMTRRVTQQIERMAVVAEAVAGGDLAGRVEVVGRDEVGRLATSFNAMTESLRRTLAELSQQRALAAVGEFAASLSHEVRNALTAVRIDLQNATRQLPSDHEVAPLVTRTLDTVRRLDATVTSALRVARSGQTTMVRVDLIAVLRRATASASPSFAGNRGTLVPISPDAPVCEMTGDAAALEQLFLNLLLNAAQALSPGGCARFEVDEAPDAIVVRIADNGSGLSPNLALHNVSMVQSTKADGTGLGLPIARRIAEAHGGSLTVENVPSGGVVATVRLRRS